MDSTNIIFAMILACLGLILLMALSRPIMAAGRVVMNSFLGILAIQAMNVVLGLFELHIGVNIMTACIVGVLGLPGFAALVLISAFV